MAETATESTVPPEVLKTFTDALTTSLGSVMATSGGSSGGIQVMVGTTPQNGFSLNIVYAGTTYSLTFGMPNADNPAWTASISMTPDGKPTIEPLVFSYNP